MTDDRATVSQKVGRTVIIGGLVLGAFLIGGALGNWNPFGGGTPYENIGPTVVDSVRAISQLATVEMVEYTTIEKGNDRGWLNWAQGDRIFMFAVARIGAGVDLGRMGVESFVVDEETGDVTVRLPTPQILFVEVDNSATQVYDRDTGIFTGGDPRLESDARAAAEDVLVQAALERGILQIAEDNAETALRQFLTGLGYERITFEKVLTP
jgi:hypothetical protein